MGCLMIFFSKRQKSIGGAYTSAPPPPPPPIEDRIKTAIEIELQTDRQQILKMLSVGIG